LPRYPPALALSGLAQQASEAPPWPAAASISELANITGRKQGNLSRTLKTMSRYGLVKMEKNERSVRPISHVESYQIMV
jgi:predicted transcriptional regulator